MLDKYKPPFNITNSMLMHVSSISEKLGKISVLYGMEEKPHLRKNNRIKSVHSSLKIEANSLSLGQVRDVIDGRMVLGDAKEIQEVKNAYEAYEKISDINPYSLKDLKKMHGIMTKFTLAESGVFRSGEEGVFNGEKCIFMAPPARFVPELMKDLFLWMERAHENVHPLILSAVFHYEFVFIHPFADGNGRMARLWHTAILSKWKPVFLYIPLESQIELFQEGYYEAIARCHSAGSSDIFIEFMLKQIDMILDSALIRPTLENNETTGYVKKLLSVMEPGISYTSLELMERLHLKSKETFRKNYLNPAMVLHIVEMTVPDKPRSKNQRYILK